MSEQNKAVVRRTVEEIWNAGNYTALHDLTAEDIVVRGATPEHDIHGHEGLRAFYSALHAGFPDIRFTIEDQIAEGDRVVTRWSANARHSGPFQGIPATGKQVHLTGIDIDRLASGKVVECWALFDQIGLMQQLGVIPQPQNS